jgi:hypothetical protein
MYVVRLSRLQGYPPTLGLVCGICPVAAASTFKEDPENGLGGLLESWRALSWTDIADSDNVPLDAPVASRSASRGPLGM